MLGLAVSLVQNIPCYVLFGKVVHDTQSKEMERSSVCTIYIYIYSTYIRTISGPPSNDEASNDLEASRKHPQRERGREEMSTHLSIVILVPPPPPISVQPTKRPAECSQESLSSSVCSYPPPTPDEIICVRVQADVRRRPDRKCRPPYSRAMALSRPMEGEPNCWS